MKTTQRRPSGLALRLVVATASLAAVSEAWRALAFPTPWPLPVAPATVVASATLCLCIVAIFDWRSLSRSPGPRVERSLPRSLALNTWAEVRLRFHGNPSLRGELQLLDGAPMSAEVAGLPLAVPDARVELADGHYSVRPLERGEVRFDAMIARGRSPLGLWCFTASCGEAEGARVYPNYATAGRFDALLAQDHAVQVGIKRRQRRGEGLEFHQLREYRLGDSPRQIDWKATSRKRELISREYEDERDQQVVFLLDCSRRMRAKDGELSHFDHGLNAMILLSHIALRGGDAVGLSSFGEERRWLSPQKGHSSVHRILDTVYDLQATTIGIDYRSAAEEVARRQRRRALVILLTQVEPADGPELLSSLRVLQRRHLVLLVNLRQRELDTALQSEVHDFRDALITLGAFEQQQERHELMERLRHDGIEALDVVPQQLTPQLVSQYYAIKRSGAL